MRPSQPWALLLLPGGLAAGHLLGYAGADPRDGAPSAAAAHDALHLLLALAVPLSLVVLTRILLSGARREQIRVSFGALVRQQVVAFIALEIAEHAAAGTPPITALREPTMLAGIVGQLVVATVLAVTLSAARAVGQRFATPSASFSARSASAAAPPPLQLMPLLVVSVWSLSRRGPPLSFL